MVIKAERYSTEDLLKVQAVKVSVISIEASIESEKLHAIKKLLQANSEIRIVLIVDPATSASEGKYSNLEIIRPLGEINHLTILAFGSAALQDLNLLEGLTKLVSFRLDGNYKKDIDLGPLKNATGIEELELEFGLSGAKQIAFVNDLAYLRRIRVSALDLKAVPLNYGVEELIITNTLKSPELLASIFPRLKMLTISKAKGIDSFDFIALLKGLQSLQIGHTSKLTNLPKMDDPLRLRSLHLVAVKQFDDLESILQFKQLEELKITEPTRMELSEFIKLKDIRSLKKVYAVFPTEAEDRAFQQMATQIGWEF